MTSSQKRATADTRAHERRPMVGYALAVLAALGWATGGILSKWLMTAPYPGGITAGWLIQPLGFALEPAVLAGARAVSATVILGIVLSVTRRADFKLANPRRDLALLVPFGAVSLAGVHFTYFTAIQHTSVATAILLQYLAPIFTLGYAVLVLRDRLRWQMPVGVALALAGAAVVVGVFSPGGLTISTLGLTWGLIAAVWFAGYTILGEVGGRRLHPYTTLFYSLLFAALMWLVVLGPRNVVAPFTDPSVAIAIGCMAVFSTIVPFGAYLLALRHISPTHASVTAMLEPVAAGFGALVVLGESMTTSLIAGGVLVIGAIALIQLSESRAIVHSETVSEGEVSDARGVDGGDADRGGELADVS